MRQVILALATVGILCVAANQAQAHHPRHHVYVGPRVVYRAPIMVPPPIMRAPMIVAPAPMYRPPVYRYRHYYEPTYGFQYYGRGVSVNVGF